jgi:hypothetical protein
MTYSVQKVLKRAREGVDAPLAYGFVYGECGDPGCPAIHLSFYRRDGRPICRAALTTEHIEAIARRAGFALVREGH